MADQVRRLDADEHERQASVLAALDGIRAASLEIEGDSGVTNHPLLDRHLPALRDDVSLARAAAAADPPRYALAGSVAGACVYCHAPQVAPARD